MTIFWQDWYRPVFSSPELGHIVFIGTFISIQVDNIMQPVIVIFSFLCLMSKVGRASMLYSPNRTVRLCWKVWGDLDLFTLSSLEFKTHKLCWLLFWWFTITVLFVIKGVNLPDSTWKLSCWDKIFLCPYASEVF
jgi:hypothetical protein